MQTLKKLTETYQNSHPVYFNPLNYANITDKELSKIKRKALQPYLEEQELSGKILVYKEKFVGFVVMSDIEMNEKGFKATVQALDPLYQPYQHHKEIEGRTWQISAPWSLFLCNQTSICCFYVGWTIWPESNFTKYIEKIYLDEGKGPAYHSVMQSLG